MRLLVLGGTRFVGLHIVRAALAAGHQVDVFHRGRTPAPDGARSLLGDRDEAGGLAALERGAWDAVVDVSAYVPRQVREAAALLNGRVGRYVFVSTVAVYRDSCPETAEDAPLAEPPAPNVEEVTGATYGGLKVACERALDATFDGSALHVRPTYVVGPDDYTDRFASWLRRVRRGGRMAALGDPRTPLSFVDVRDLGTFTVGLAAGEAAGAVNASGPARPTTWGQVLATAARVTDGDAELIWLPRDWVAAQDVPAAAFPMASPHAFTGAAPYALDRAHTLGLTHRDVADSVRATLAWHDKHGQATAGLSDAAEADLLTAWDRERG
ncbi:MAG: NAD-dependent epimerase/dehydratase family protein [Trueperaceae bacterium]|nr:NAD-dependent epimerase/dehydratase family protein [Trueperaceae bacterium]